MRSVPPRILISSSIHDGQWRAVVHGEARPSRSKPIEMSEFTKACRWRSWARSSKRGGAISPRMKACQGRCRWFILSRDTPFAATISLEQASAGRSDHDELGRPAIPANSPKAGAARHLRGNCNPSCHHDRVRGARCRSALDGARPRLTSRTDLRSAQLETRDSPAGRR